MKNKKSIYILLPVVLVIWGIIFWKIFFKNTSINHNAHIIEKKQDLVINESHKERSVLSYNYADPFLKNATKTNSPKKNTPKLRFENQFVSWPIIKYKGLIKSKRKKAAMGLLVIGDREYLVHEKEKKDGVVIRAIYTDSIGLELQGSKKFFMRQGLK